ncbi:uncharacterized protein LOC135808962 [Sycon ciliatum]|uniref:uncharacterized protein LOC135808962 n=1 Tax=Sycon ciliatum TaxID=27933 RepID=UPI0031F6D808
MDHTSTVTPKQVPGRGKRSASTTPTSQNSVGFASSTTPSAVLKGRGRSRGKVIPVNSPVTPGGLAGRHVPTPATTAAASDNATLPTDSESNGADAIVQECAVHPLETPRPATAGHACHPGQLSASHDTSDFSAAPVHRDDDDDGQKKQHGPDQVREDVSVALLDDDNDDSRNVSHGTCSITESNDSASWGMFNRGALSAADAAAADDEAWGASAATSTRRKPDLLELTEEQPSNFDATWGSSATSDSAGSWGALSNNAGTSWGNMKTEGNAKGSPQTDKNWPKSTHSNSRSAASKTNMDDWGLSTDGSGKWDNPKKSTNARSFKSESSPSHRADATRWQSKSRHASASEATKPAAAASRCSFTFDDLPFRKGTALASHSSPDTLPGGAVLCVKNLLDDHRPAVLEVQRVRELLLDRLQRYRPFIRSLSIQQGISYMLFNHVHAAEAARDELTSLPVPVRYDNRRLTFHVNHNPEKLTKSLEYERRRPESIVTAVSQLQVFDKDSWAKKKPSSDRAFSPRGASAAVSNESPASLDWPTTEAAPVTSEQGWPAGIDRPSSAASERVTSKSGQGHTTERPQSRNRNSQGNGRWQKERSTLPRSTPDQLATQLSSVEIGARSDILVSSSSTVVSSSGGDLNVTASGALFASPSSSAPGKMGGQLTLSNSDGAGHRGGSKSNGLSSQSHAKHSPDLPTLPGNANGFTGKTARVPRLGMNKLHSDTTSSDLRTCSSGPAASQLPLPPFDRSDSAQSMSTCSGESGVKTLSDGDCSSVSSDSFTADSTTCASVGGKSKSRNTKRHTIWVGSLQKSLGPTKLKQLLSAAVANLPGLVDVHINGAIGFINFTNRARTERAFAILSAKPLLLHGSAVRLRLGDDDVPTRKARLEDDRRKNHSATSTSSWTSASSDTVGSSRNQASTSFNQQAVLQSPERPPASDAPSTLDSHFTAGPAKGALRPPAAMTMAASVTVSVSGFSVHQDIGGVADFFSAYSEWIVDIRQCADDHVLVDFSDLTQANYAYLELDDTEWCGRPVKLLVIERAQKEENVPTTSQAVEQVKQTTASRPSRLRQAGQIRLEKAMSEHCFDFLKKSWSSLLQGLAAPTGGQAAITFRWSDGAASLSGPSREALSDVEHKFFTSSMEENVELTEPQWFRWNRSVAMVAKSENTFLAQLLTHMISGSFASTLSEVPGDIGWLTENSSWAVCVFGLAKSVSRCITKLRACLKACYPLNRLELEVLEELRNHLPAMEQFDRIHFDGFAEDCRVLHLVPGVSSLAEVNVEDKLDALDTVLVGFASQSVDIQSVLLPSARVCASQLCQPYPARSAVILVCESGYQEPQSNDISKSLLCKVHVCGLDSEVVGHVAEVLGAEPEQREITQVPVPMSILTDSGRENSLPCIAKEFSVAYSIVPSSQAEPNSDVTPCTVQLLSYSATEVESAMSALTSFVASISTTCSQSVRLDTLRHRYLIRIFHDRPQDAVIEEIAELCEQCNVEIKYDRLKDSMIITGNLAMVEQAQTCLENNSVIFGRAKTNELLVFCSPLLVDYLNHAILQPTLAALSVAAHVEAPSDTAKLVGAVGGSVYEIQLEPEAGCSAKDNILVVRFFGRAAQLTSSLSIVKKELRCSRFAAFLIKSSLLSRTVYRGCALVECGVEAAIMADGMYTSTSTGDTDRVSRPIVALVSNERERVEEAVQMLAEEETNHSTAAVAPISTGTVRQQDQTNSELLSSNENDSLSSGQGDLVHYAAPITQSAVQPDRGTSLVSKDAIVTSQPAGESDMGLSEYQFTLTRLQERFIMLHMRERLEDMKTRLHVTKAQLDSGESAVDNPDVMRWSLRCTDKPSRTQPVPQVLLAYQELCTITNSLRKVNVEVSFPTSFSQIAQRQVRQAQGLVESSRRVSCHLELRATSERDASAPMPFSVCTAVISVCSDSVQVAREAAHSLEHVVQNLPMTTLQVPRYALRPLGDIQAAIEQHLGIRLVRLNHTSSDGADYPIAIGAESMNSLQAGHRVVTNVLQNLADLHTRVGNAAAAASSPPPLALPAAVAAAAAAVATPPIPAALVSGGATGNATALQAPVSESPTLALSSYRQPENGTRDACNVATWPQTPSTVNQGSGAVRQPVVEGAPVGKCPETSSPHHAPATDLPEVACGKNGDIDDEEEDDTVPSTCPVAPPSQAAPVQAWSTPRPPASVTSAAKMQPKRNLVPLRPGFPGSRLVRDTASKATGDWKPISYASSVKRKSSAR